ncbi:retrovirus-related pol polyprotein from transposon TNT 1-94 [Tanacetum coccineum]
MDLYGPMRVESINGKRYVLVIVEDYSRYTWVHFLRSKDEAPEEIKTFLKKIIVLLQALVIMVRSDDGIEFKNQVLKEYFDSVGISQPSSFCQTPSNRVIERKKTKHETVRQQQAPLVLQTPTTSTTIADTALTPTNSSSQATNIPNTSQDVDELEQQQQHKNLCKIHLLLMSTEVLAESSSSQYVESIEPCIHGDMCMYALTVSTMEPSNVKEAMKDHAWIESMQEELL